jgi:HPt (histidine-containing phosphotransfer) domain-containing protein
MEEKLYNLDYLNSISGGDQEFINEMIRTFVVSSPDEIIAIKRLAADKSWIKVGEESHRFASSLLFLGLDNLKALAIDIENKGLQQIDGDKIPVLLEQLEDGCSQVITQLKRDFNVLVND